MSEKIHQRLEENHYSDLSGLGRSAVHLAIQHAYEKRVGLDSDENIVNKKVQQARDEFENQPSLAMEAIENNQISPYLNNIIMGEISEPSPGRIVGKLTQKNENGERVVDDRTFLKFLEWYNFAHKQRQNETAEQVDRHIVEFWHQLEKAKNDGWMPRFVLESNINKLEDVRYASDDGYEFQKKE